MSACSWNEKQNFVFPPKLLPKFLSFLSLSFSTKKKKRRILEVDSKLGDSHMYILSSPEENRDSLTHVNLDVPLPFLTFLPFSFFSLPDYSRKWKTKAFERQKKKKKEKLLSNFSFSSFPFWGLPCSKCTSFSREVFQTLNLETWAREPLDRIMLKWSWTSPLLTIHNLVSTKLVVCQGSTCILDRMPVPHQAELLLPAGLQVWSPIGPKSWTMRQSRSTFFTSLVSQASGLEAFSRYPLRGSVSTFSCRRVENTIHVTQRFLSYWVGLLSRQF